MAEQLPNIVDGKEQVARIIFSPSYICNGRVAPTAFRLEVLPSGDVEDYISVLRGSTDSLSQQSRHIRARTEGDSRYGYALMRVTDIRNVGKGNLLIDELYVDVRAFPSKAHPNHAGIEATIYGNKITAFSPITPEIMMLQKSLAMLCSDIVKF